MSERTVIAVVRDLINTGLSVEQQILVNELVIVAADEQRKAAFERGYEDGLHDAEISRKEAQAERKRLSRTSRTVTDKRKSPIPPKENIILNKNNPPTPLAEPLFEEFWKIYPLRVGKGAARKAYRNALARASHAEILAGARKYAASKPDPKFTKHPSTWLNADCWLDEGDNVVVSFRPGPAPRSWAEIKAEKQQEGEQV